MKRAWIIWAAFAVCASVVLAGLAWISLSALDMERGRRQSAAEAAQGERVRLALWRMDSFLTPLLVQEASRPPDAYTAFHSLPRVYMRSANQLDGEVLVPSPLLTYESPLVRLHFQVAPDGAVSSPQVPSGDQMEMAQDYVPPAAVAGRLEQLIQLKRSLRGREILASLPREPAQLPPVTRPWDASNPQYGRITMSFASVA